jgi:hypothetical protein
MGGRFCYICQPPKFPMEGLAKHSPNVIHSNLQKGGCLVNKVVRGTKLEVRLWAMAQY